MSHNVRHHMVSSRSVNEPLLGLCLLPPMLPVIALPLPGDADRLGPPGGHERLPPLLRHARGAVHHVEAASAVRTVLLRVQTLESQVSRPLLRLLLLLLLLLLRADSRAVGARS